MKEQMVSAERSNDKTFNIVYLIQVLKHYSELEPVKLKDLSRRCEFCSEDTLRNLLDALYRRTNSKDKNLDFRLIKYIKDKDSNTFKEWDVNDINGGKTFYYKIEFDTKKSEIKLLTDALSMFPFLSSDQSIKLINTIEKICSVPDIYNFRKTMNEYEYKALHSQESGQAYASDEFFNVIESISRAIKEKRAVKFDYYMYSSNPEKTKLVFGKRSEKTFHPAFFIWSNGFYYIVGKDDSRIDETFTNLRVDRIKDVEICEKKSLAEMEQVNAAKYRDENPVMYAGERVTVEFRVRESLLNAVVDSFGRQISISDTNFTDSLDNEYVIVKTDASIAGAAMWLTEYCNLATAIAPISLVEKVKDILKEGLKLY